jgi:uncharacterized protein YkwD
VRGLLLLTAGLATVCVLAPVASSKSTTPGVERRAAIERAVGRELNRVRAAHSLQPLRIGDGLRVAAARHSRSMLELGFFEHTSPDGTSFDQRIRRFYSDRGWRSWAVGETLFSSSTAQISAREIVTTWLESPPHRQVILSHLYRDAGVGVYFAPSASGQFRGEQALVVTADFGVREK